MQIKIRRQSFANRRGEACLPDQFGFAMECEERDRHAIANRIRDAQLPRVKTLEDFDFSRAPQIPAAKIRDLAQGGYIERVNPSF